MVNARVDIYAPMLFAIESRIEHQVGPHAPVAVDIHRARIAIARTAVIDSSRRDATLCLPEVGIHSPAHLLGREVVIVVQIKRIVPAAFEPRVADAYVLQISVVEHLDEIQHIGLLHTTAIVCPELARL